MAAIVLTVTTAAAHGAGASGALTTAGFAISYGLSENLVSYFRSAQFQQAVDQYLATSTPTTPVTNAPTTSPSAPVLNLTATPSIARAGDYVTLSWQSQSAQSCVASGDWLGYKPLNGTQVIGPVTADQRFLLSCSGSGNGALAEATVQVNNQSGVAVELTANEIRVGRNTPVELTWSARNADYCVAGSDWQGQRAVSGTFATEPLTQSATFQITCYDGATSAMEMVTVQVEDSILSWRAPTRNENGDPLDTIAGYKIYWGKAPQQYSDNVLVPADTTEWWADLLPGTYYFAMSTVDGRGVESDLSAELAINVD